MGHNDRIPIASEKKYAYEGIFDLKDTYQFIKQYMEDSLHYDVSEKDYEETNNGDSKRIFVKFEAEQEYTDYYKIIIKYSLEMTGKEITINMNNKDYHRLKGKSKLVVNAYVETDWMEKRQHSPMSEFFNKLYDKFFGQDDLNKCIFSGVKDVSTLITIFKQQMNTTL